MVALLFNPVTVRVGAIVLSLIGLKDVFDGDEKVAVGGPGASALAHFKAQADRARVVALAATGLAAVASAAAVAVTVTAIKNGGRRG